MPQDNDPEEGNWKGDLYKSQLFHNPCHIQTNYCVYVVDIHFDTIF